MKGNGDDSRNWIPSTQDSQGLYFWLPVSGIVVIWSSELMDGSSLSTILINFKKYLQSMNVEEMRYVRAREGRSKLAFGIHCSYFLFG